MDSREKADVLARARGAAAIYITKESKGADDSPEKILYDAGEQTAKQMLAEYRAKMDSFSAVPIDAEGKLVRLYKGEWSIISGHTGTGKTTFLRQLICHQLKAGKNVFVATLEQDPRHYIVELAGTAAGVAMPSEAQLQSFLDTYGSQLKLWGMIGVAEHRKILATIRELSDAGLDYAFIDSLMMLDIDSGDFEGQRKFAALLSATVQAKNVHIMLVAHPKKKMSADQDPSTDDVSGSNNIVNLAYSLYFIRRGPETPNNDNITEMELWSLKQRTYGRTGTLTGFFYYDQRQFHLDCYAQGPTFYLDGKHYPATGLTEQMPEQMLNPNAFKVDQLPMTKAPWEL